MINEGNNKKNIIATLFKLNFIEMIEIKKIKNIKWWLKPFAAMRKKVADIPINIKTILSSTLNFLSS